ncbi:MAG: O-antigen ligase family protein [Chloroflexi bacterium]|nr:O-antigen ligase family protein [Chloroflexota bacterium]
MSIVQFEPAAILGAGLMALSSATLLPFAIAMLIGLRLWHWYLSGLFTQRTLVDSPILFLLLLMPLNQWISIKPEVTWVQVLRLVFGMVWFYAVINWANTLQRIEHIGFALVLFGCALALAAPFIVNQRGGKLPFLPDALYDWFVPIVSRTMNANVFAGTLVIIAPLAFAQILFGVGIRRQQVFFALAFMLMAIMLFISQSRGGLIAFGISIAAMLGCRGLLIINLRLILLGRRFRALVVILGLILAFSWQFVNLSRLFNSLLANPSLGGLDARLEIWQRAIYIIQDFAYTGVGMGMFEPVSLLLYAAYVSKFDIPHAHNLFLQVAVDLGLPGFMAWFIILIKTLQAAIQAYQWQLPVITNISRALAVGLIGSQIALIIHGLTDAVLWGVVRASPIIWLIWALCLALRKITFLESISTPKSLESKVNAKTTCNLINF